MINGVKAIVFDFDGLLMDTESVMLRSWQYEWSQWGLTLDVDGFFVDHGGDVTEERYDALAREVGKAYDRGVSHQRRIEYRNHLHASLQLAPGIDGWIGEADAHGLTLAIASSSPLDWLHSHLDRVGIRHRFSVIAGGDEVAQPKPDPDVYELALNRLETGPAEAVAVEDSPHGVVAAHAAGLRCVAIPNPHIERRKLAGAEIVLDSAATIGLREVLQQLPA